MNKDEVIKIINIVEELFPEWKPTSSETSLIYSRLYRYDFTAAKRAAEETAINSNRHQLPKAVFFNNCSKYQEDINQHKPPTETPRPSVFLMYEGFGETTLLPGYFVPVIVKAEPGCPYLVSGAIVENVAHNLKAARELQHGGTWTVYINATEHEMNNLRNERRAALPQHT